MPTPFLHSLSLYPIKSCRGIPLARAEVTERGLMVDRIGDRRWMVIDSATYQLISQREATELARVGIALVEGEKGAEKIRVVGDDKEPLIVNPAFMSNEVLDVVIHGKKTIARSTGLRADQWFSDYLKRDVRLVFQDQDDSRFCDPHFAVRPGEDKVSLADGYPYLIVTLGTLNKLNAQLTQAVDMNRFRPNIVIGGVEDEAEYGWRTIKIGDVVFELVKPCTRCVVTTIDQENGVKTGKEPLATLAKSNFLSQMFGEARVQGAIFGENAIPLRMGPLALGDEVSILETKEPYAFRRPLSSPRPA